MGKKKKQFIDKKTAHSYRLVHRSQKDPLQADEESSAFVLQPFQQPTGGASASAGAEGSSYDASPPLAEHLTEQRKFGVFYDDGYNYMQHLRDRGEATLVLEETMEADKHKNDPVQVGENLHLPASVFASEQEESVGLLNKAAPRPGPRLDLDPDIVECLDEDFTGFADEADLEDFEDDFVLMANGGEAAHSLGDVEGGEGEGDEDDWEDMDSDEEDEDEDDEDSDSPDSDARSDVAVGDVYDDAYHRRMLGLNEDDVADDRRSRFTDYSMTSAVIKRSDGLQLLDARFEKFVERWDEEDEVGMHGAFCSAADGPEPTHPHFAERMQQLVKEYQDEKRNPPTLETLMAGDATTASKEYRKTMASVADRFRYEKSDDEGEEELEVVPMSSKPQFDCESIRSFSSRASERQMPGIIRPPPKAGRAKTNSQNDSSVAEAAEGISKIVLDPKTGFPTGVLHEKPKKVATVAESEERDEAEEGLVFVRRKDESREEKKIRKKATKECKRERRVEKKTNKLAFETERKRQVVQSAAKAPSGISM